MKIQKDSEVIAHIKIMLKDKSVAQDTRDDDTPVQILMGKEHVSDAFETQLLEMQAGDKKAFMLDAKDAFGESDPAGLHTIPRDQFDAEEQLEPGTIFMFKQPNGAELPGLIRKLTDKEATVDFNHPLAGKTLIFEVEVISVS